MAPGTKHALWSVTVGVVLFIVVCLIFLDGYRDLARYANSGEISDERYATLRRWRASLEDPIVRDGFDYQLRIKYRTGGEIDLGEYRELETWYRNAQRSFERTALSKEIGFTP